LGFLRRTRGKGVAMAAVERDRPIEPAHQRPPGRYGAPTII
jgi:hypothetical protein